MLFAQSKHACPLEISHLLMLFFLWFRSASAATRDWMPQLCLRPVGHQASIAATVQQTKPT
jgi:hypothetical protein